MRSDVLASLLGIFLGIGVVCGALRLGVGAFTGPRPGFFPLLGGASLVVLSLVLGVQAWLARNSETEAFGTVRRPAMLILGMAAYVATLDSLGYVPATMLFTAVSLRIMGVASRRELGASSVALSVGTYLLFDRVLRVELPGGVLQLLIERFNGI